MIHKAAYCLGLTQNSERKILRSTDLPDRLARHNIYIYIYIYIYICVCVCVCVFWQHFFINSNFVEYSRHFLSTYFLVDPFISI